MPLDEARLDLEVSRETDVPLVAGSIRDFCLDLGFTATATAYVMTAASELANNLWMHADHGGRVWIRAIHSEGRCGVELVTEDDGPGIPDIPRAMEEGFSTGGGLGCGLPGVARLMDSMAIESAGVCGTRVVTRKWRDVRPS